MSALQPKFRMIILDDGVLLEDEKGKLSFCNDYSVTGYIRDHRPATPANVVAELSEPPPLEESTPVKYYEGLASTSTDDEIPF